MLCTAPHTRDLCGRNPLLLASMACSKYQVHKLTVRPNASVRDGVSCQLAVVCAERGRFYSFDFSVVRARCTPMVIVIRLCVGSLIGFDRHGGRCLWLAAFEGKCTGSVFACHPKAAEAPVGPLHFAPNGTRRVGSGQSDSNAGSSCCHSVLAARAAARRKPVPT